MGIFDQQLQTLGNQNQRLLGQDRGEGTMLQQQGGDIPERVLWLDGTMVERRPPPNISRSTLPHWPTKEHNSNVSWKYYNNMVWTKKSLQNQPDRLWYNSQNGDLVHHRQSGHAALLLDYTKAARPTTRHSDGNSKKNLATEIAFPPFDFHFSCPVLSLLVQPMISVRSRIDSAAIYHHDPNSVRTWPTLPWTFSTSSWTCSFGALLGQQENHWKRSTQCTRGLLFRTSQNGTPGWGASEHTSTWPSTTLFGTQHYSHDYWSTPRGGLQDCRHTTGLFTYTYTLHSIWCLWPNERTTWQLPGSTASKVCLPSLAVALLRRWIERERPNHGFMYRPETSDSPPSSPDSLQSIHHDRRHWPMRKQPYDSSTMVCYGQKMFCCSFCLKYRIVFT